MTTVRRIGCLLSQDYTSNGTTSPSCKHKISELRINESIQINASNQTNLAANDGSNCHQVRVSEENRRFRPQTVSCRPEPMETAGRTSTMLGL